MRIRSNLRGTKGFVVAWERAVRFRYMITEHAKRRTRILAFWEEYEAGDFVGPFKTGEDFIAHLKTL